MQKDIILPNVQHFNEETPHQLDEAINWLYPNATYDPIVAIKRIILAGTNKEGIHEIVLFIFVIIFILHFSGPME